MTSKSLAAALLLALSVAVPALGNADAVQLPPIDDKEIAAVRRILQKHFTPRELDGFTAYLKDLGAGRERPLPPELKNALRGSISDLRLEYGLQLAILFAQIQQQHPGLIDGDINELLDKLQESLSDSDGHAPR